MSAGSGTMPSLRSTQLVCCIVTGISHCGGRGQMTISCTFGACWHLDTLVAGAVCTGAIIREHIIQENIFVGWLSSLDTPASCL
jgi:hypothetical protein